MFCCIFRSLWFRDFVKNAIHHPAFILVYYFQGHLTGRWNLFVRTLLLDGPLPPSQLEVNLLILLFSLPSQSSMVFSLHSTLSLEWVDSECKNSWKSGSHTLQNQCSVLNCLMAFNILGDINWQAQHNTESMCQTLSYSFDIHFRTPDQRTVLETLSHLLWLSSPCRTVQLGFSSFHYGTSTSPGSN